MLEVCLRHSQMVSNMFYVFWCFKQQIWLPHVFFKMPRWGHQPEKQNDNVPGQVQIDVRALPCALALGGRLFQAGDAEMLSKPSI